MTMWQHGDPRWRQSFFTRIWRNVSIHCRNLSASLSLFLPHMSDLIHAARPLTEFLMFPTFTIKPATVSLKFKRQLMINESRILPREAHSCMFHSCAPKIVYAQQNAPLPLSSLVRHRSALLCQTESWQHMCDISMWPVAAIPLGSNCTAACTDVFGATRTRSVEAHGVYQWKESLPPSGIKVT